MPECIRTTGAQQLTLTVIPSGGSHIVPIGIISPEGHVPSVDGTELARLVHAYPVVLYPRGQRGANALSVYGNAKHLHTLHSLRIGVEQTINTRSIGRNVAARPFHAVFPFPVSRVGFAVR